MKSIHFNNIAADSFEPRSNAVKVKIEESKDGDIVLGKLQEAADEIAFEKWKNQVWKDFRSNSEDTRARLPYTCDLAVSYISSPKSSKLLKLHCI